MAAYPTALIAKEVQPRARKSIYPEEFAARIGERIKRPLGDQFGLTIFGVNLTTLKPGAMSALRHAHHKQDEFVYILEGSAILVTDEGETPLSPGMCAGFKAGTGNGHHLLNRGRTDVVYLEIGDRTPGDAADYPDDDLVAVKSPDGKSRTFEHKDGTPY
jgi:uncharacterized cupin superfamily protein